MVLGLLAPSYSKTRTRVVTSSRISAAQITSVFAALGRGEDVGEEGLTAVLYPYHRIKMTELTKPGPVKPPQVQPQSVEPPTPPCPPPDRQVAEKSGTFLNSNYFFTLTIFFRKHGCSR